MFLYPVFSAFLYKKKSNLTGLKLALANSPMRVSSPSGWWVKLQFEKKSNIICGVILSKLYHYGIIRGPVNEWFSSYLNGRVQTTQIDKQISSKRANRGPTRLCSRPSTFLALY